MARIESNFKCYSNSYIKTSNGKDTTKEHAMGPFQIKPSTAKQLCNEMNINYFDNILYDPIISSKICSYYIKKLLLLFDNNLEAAIKAYNVGPSNYRKGIFKESQKKYWDIFKKEYKR